MTDPISRLAQQRMNTLNNAPQQDPFPPQYDTPMQSPVRRDKRKAFGVPVDRLLAAIAGGVARYNPQAGVFGNLAGGFAGSVGMGMQLDEQERQRQKEELDAQFRADQEGRMQSQLDEIIRHNKASEGEQPTTRQRDYNFLIGLGHTQEDAFREAFGVGGENVGNPFALWRATHPNGSFDDYMRDQARWNPPPEMKPDPESVIDPVIGTQTFRTPSGKDGSFVTTTDRIHQGDEARAAIADAYAGPRGDAALSLAMNNSPVALAAAQRNIKALQGMALGIFGDDIVHPELRKRLRLEARRALAEIEAQRR